MKPWRLCALLLLAGVFNLAQAAPYPDQAIKILIGFAPGSSVDIITRLIALKLGDRLGHPVIVENRPGAGGNIAAQAVTRAAPNGYTLLACNTGLAIAPSIYKNLTFKPTDLVAVAQMTSSPHVLVSPINLPANSIPELIALAKSQPGKYNLGSAGVGNADHLTGELLNSMAHINLVHVPYQGGAQVMTDVVIGNVAVFFSGLPGALPMIRAGKVKALGVGTAKRSWALPDVPAIAETLPGFDVSLWNGLMAPAGTPKPIIDKISNEIAAILKQPETLKTLHQMGVDPADASSAHFEALYKSEVKRWATVVREANVKLD